MKNRYNTYEFLPNFIVMYDMEGNVCILDSEVYQTVKEHYWHRNSKGAWVSGKIRLNRFLMDPPDNHVVEFKDGDKNDFRYSNLKILSRFMLKNEHFRNKMIRFSVPDVELKISEEKNRVVKESKKIENEINQQNSSEPAPAISCLMSIFYLMGILIAMGVIYIIVELLIF